MNIILLLVRALSLAFAAIVLALSVVLAKGQLVGSPPAVTGYAAFCGGFGLVVGIFGIIVDLIEAIPNLFMGIMDALATLAYLAGSIALAVKLGVHSCTPDASELEYFHVPKSIAETANFYTYFNPVINGGADEDVDYTGRCREAQADAAFLFFALACFAACTVLSFLGGSGGSMRRGGTSYV